MSTAEACKDEQLGEIEAIQAIYGDDYHALDAPNQYEVRLHATVGCVDRPAVLVVVQIHVVPNTHQVQHVAATLKVEYPAMYPNEVPRLYGTHTCEQEMGTYASLS